MAVNGNFFKLYNMIGNYRSFLSSRISLPMYQPVATLKQSLEESIGLPPKPKRPLTPFFVFNKGLRPAIVQKSPDLKMIEVTKMLAREWRKTGQDVKDKMQADYEIKLQEYYKDKKKYYESMTDAQKAQLQAVKSEGRIQKEKKLHGKALKNLGKPKRPMAAVYRWIQSLGTKRGTMPLAEWQKLMMKKWEALPEAERRKFEEQQIKDFEEYKIEVRKWEEKMITLGNHDILTLRANRQGKKAAKENTDTAE